jgi:hypothetical protein
MFRLRAPERLEERRLPAGMWQNPAVAEDVDASGDIRIQDLLTVIQDLRTFGNPHMLVPPAAGNAPPPFVDVSGDDVADVKDLLLVVTALREGVAFNAPALEADLANDTGAGGADRISEDPTVSGAITQNLHVRTHLVGRIEDGPWQRISLDEDGAFSFHPSFAGDGSDDGRHTIELVAQTAGGPPMRTSVTLVLKQDAFPFTIENDQFLRGNDPVFLNILGYSPLTPGQSVLDPLDESRLNDDLRRWEAYAKESEEPLLLRLYPNPINESIRFPQSFFDRLRELNIYVIRDIYFHRNTDFTTIDEAIIAEGKEAIDAAIAELEQADALDQLFAFEWGNEFLRIPDPDNVEEYEAFSSEQAAELTAFFAAMNDHIKTEMAKPGRDAFSNWFTWGSLPAYDRLFSDSDGFTGDSVPVVPESVDFYSYNIYPYFPAVLREHQAGMVTGTPFAGYLDALKQSLGSSKPLVISETGLPSSPQALGDPQTQLPPWYSVYRYGGLTEAQVAEGLADRYFDARLSGNVAGLSFFQWNDEWWKAGDPAQQAPHPEEHFGIARFEETAPGEHELRYKLQQDVVRELVTLDFVNDQSVIAGLQADVASLAPGESSGIHVTLADGAQDVRFRWETDRGRVVGESASVDFFAGDAALGPATVTVVAIDSSGRAETASLSIDIQPQGAPAVELITSGRNMASGRVRNVDTHFFKVALYVETDMLYQQPFFEMPEIWIGADGYFSTRSHNGFAGDVVAWIVPREFNGADTYPADFTPNEAIATDRLSGINDDDDDLLVDAWEMLHFGNLGQSRYGDPDGDGALNYEEQRSGESPMMLSNDSDGDMLLDNWERRMFGTLQFDTDDDPDGDMLTNELELELELHPGRIAIDSDLDGLPDRWERRFFGDLEMNPGDSFGDETVLGAYELGLL